MTLACLRPSARPTAALAGAAVVAIETAAAPAETGRAAPKRITPAGVGGVKLGMTYLGRPDQEWCSVACGNRARAARHYARRRVER